MREGVAKPLAQNSESSDGGQYWADSQGAGLYCWTFSGRLLDRFSAAPTAIDTVQKPVFQKAGQFMYAAVASTDKGVIHGLFADTPERDLPQANNAKLTRLGSVGNVVTALASLGGSTLMIGTDNGRIVSFDLSFRLSLSLRAAGSGRWRHCLPHRDLSCAAGGRSPTRQCICARGWADSVL